MTSKLFPERHPVRDFFVLDVLDVVPRADMASLEHPIFSLSTKTACSTQRYENNDVKVEIIPSALGFPTVFDKDILIYCISKLIHMKERQGKEIGPNVRLTTHDLLVQTNRPTNNLGYERLLPALNRLRGVVINTTIATGGEQTTRGFGLIDEFEYNRRGSMFSDRRQYLEIRLSDWLFRAIEKSEVLPISRDYFRLRGPIDRRLYDLARKHCGGQRSFRISSALLQKKCGSRQAEKYFAAHLRELARSNHLPDYAVTLEGEQVVFWRRGDAPPDRHPSPALPGLQQEPSRPSIRLSEDAIDQVRGVAPGWDKYFLERMYLDWAANLEPARSEDARFLSWAKSFTKGKPPG